MKTKIKEFYKDHMGEILVLGGVGLIVIVTAIATRQAVLDSEKAKDFGRSIIKFTDKGSRLKMEEVVDFLGKHNDSRGSFAFVHNGGEVDSYIGVLLD